MHRLIAGRFKNTRNSAAPGFSALRNEWNSSTARSFRCHRSEFGTSAVNRLNKFFIRRSRDRFEVSPQNPFNLDEESQPQPDLTLLDTHCNAPARYAEPADIFLIIEVADSTVPYDRSDKGPAYAAEGIREFGKPDHLLYDLKYVLPAGMADLRL